MRNRILCGPAILATLGIVSLATGSVGEKQTGSNVIKVDTKGVVASILYEAPISGGHLPELKAKYKLRVTEITIEAGGYVGEHNHVGPGIRQMTAGEMEYIMPDMTTTYRAGDFFFEPGDVSHRVLNKTAAPCKHLLFEILPVHAEGPSLIPLQERAGR